MVLAEAVISAITSLAVFQGFEKVKEKKSDNGATIEITGEKNGKQVSIVKFKNESIKSPQFDVVELDTATVVDEGAPHYILTNTSSVDKRIFAIGFVPNTTFKSDGIISMKIAGHKFFPITKETAGMLNNVAQINVPIPQNFGFRLNESDAFEVFLSGSGKGVLTILVGNVR